MAVNGDGAPVTNLFGFAVPAGTGAEGSAGAPAPQSDDTFRVPVTSPFMSVQNVSPPMVGAGLDDTSVPGQLVEGISGLGPTQTASTGAGLGSAGHSPHPNAAA